MEKLLGKIVLEILEYQKLNNIVNKCMTNTQLLYDIMSNFGIKNIKVEAVIAISPPTVENPILTVCAGHLVLMVGDVLTEASYDIYSMPNKVYTRNTKELLDHIKTEHTKNPLTTDLNRLHNDIHFCIDTHLHFKTISDNINNGVKYGGDYYRELKNHILYKFKDYIGTTKSLI